MRYNIVPEEVEEVCKLKPVVQRGIKRNRLILLGVTGENRLLNVVLENHGVGNYYVVTAYDASPEDTKLYIRLRGVVTMKQMKNKIKSRIPEFKNYDEEAKWWESHNLADYQDEFETIKVQFGKNLSAGLNIRLDPATLVKLRKEASQKGIGPTTLVRMLLMEHFHQQI